MLDLHHGFTTGIMKRICLIESLESRALFSAYFVAPTGSDTGLGTSAAPWKTIQKAFDSVKAGDVVTVRAGEYAGASRMSMKGTAAAPILFKADPGVLVTSKAVKETAVDTGLELYGYDDATRSTYVTLDGFTVNNASGTISTDGSSGFRIRWTDHVTLRNCTAVNNGWMGFYTSRNTNLTIANSESAFNNGFVDPLSTARNHGIYVDGGSSYVTLSNNSVHDNNGNGIHSNENSNHLLIEGNRVFNNGAIGGSALNNDGLQDSVIRNNLLYNNKAKGLSLYNRDSVNPASGNTIINNTIIQPGGTSALTVLGAAINTKIYNNILVTPGGPTIYFDDAARPGSAIDNNVHVSSSSLPFSGGVGGDTRMSLATWRSTDGFDARGIITTSAKLFMDPANNDYRLLLTSPARRMADVSMLPATDISGMPRVAADADAGAYRYWLQGDANFDDIITGDDYTIIDSNLNLSSTAGQYAWGDLNYDGMVTGDDYTIIDSNLGLRA